MEDPYAMDVQGAAEKLATIETTIINSNCIYKIIKILS
jgi:hypothetical protein